MVKKAAVETVENTVNEMVTDLVTRAQRALAILETFDQAKIDNIVHQMAIAGLDQHMALAKMAVEETGRGIYEDKAIKNIFATEEIWNAIKDNKTVGVIEEDPEHGITKIAEPVGVIAGVTPVTNPTSTTIFKAEIAIKTRNPIIFAFHPSAQRCSAEALNVIKAAAVKAGMPADALLYIEEPSIAATQSLMNHEGVATVLATGGPGMVKAAYSTGKPALGVGAGNAPAYIEASANIKQAVNDLILSKSFDNGMICASEQAVIVDAEIYTAVKKEFQAQGVYFAKPSELSALNDAVIDPDKNAVRPSIPGQSAAKIAKLAGIDIPEDTPVLIAEIKGVGHQYPLSHEKLSPVLAMIKAKDREDGLQLCEAMLDLGGLGHTASLHTTDEALPLEFAKRMKACRVLVNTPSAQGGIGDLYNDMLPSLTLGCGSYGHNSISHNVSTIDLLNVKTLTKRRNNMQWVKLPSKIYFEKNSVNYLEKMADLHKVFIVADQGMVDLGYVQIVEDVLARRTDQVQVQIFADVEPDPSTDTIYKGAEVIKRFKPDTIVAIGGGSDKDPAKASWLF